MLSMTGFGRGESEVEGYKFIVDVKSVNGKFLDISVKAPKYVMVIEDKIKKLVSDNLSRGSIEIFVNISKSGTSTKTLVVDHSLVENLIACAGEISDKFGLSGNLTSKDLLRFNGVLDYEEELVDEQILEKGCLVALQNALAGLIKMRAVEGAKLYEDLKAKIGEIENSLTKVKQKVPEVVSEYYQKLKLRVSELLKEVEIDESKLANEVAFFADKADINEEIVRLESHISQFNLLLNQTKPAGKQLEFLSQEITREINTMGSKANNIVVTNLVLDMKNFNESIKEQIRNVE